MTGVAKNMITKLLAELGPACAAFMDRTFRNLSCRRVQCDEIWSFCYAKQKHVPARFQGQLGYGDVWTWVAMDADTKLVLAYLISRRGPYNCYEFIKDVAARLASRVQLTTDGLTWYIDAVDHAFGIDIDYGMIEKHYGRAAGDAVTAAFASRQQWRLVSRTTSAASLRLSGCWRMALARWCDVDSKRGCAI